MRRTFKYEAKINKTTEANADRWLELCRTLYNLALEQRILYWKQYKKSLSVYDQGYQLPEFKKNFPEFKKIDAQVLEDVLKRIDNAYKLFFQRFSAKKGNIGFPRFKSSERYDSFTLRQCSWKLEGRNLYIRNIGRFKLFLSRPIEGNIKTITIKRTNTGKWFVLFSCDNVPRKTFPETVAQIGIDVGLKNFLVDSDGHVIENPKYFKQSEKLLRRRNRSLSRKQKGSNRQKKVRVLVAKAHEKIANQRRDFLHKLANQYIQSFDTIYIEDLNVQNMIKNKYMSKSIGDSSWAEFFRILSYKAEEDGRKIVKVPSKNTSQICSQCGEKVSKSLKVRVHRCPHCGLVLDRDHNAAINILVLGQSAQAQTSTIAGVV